MGSQMESESLDVVVVGAGWNGLISAKTYLDFHPDAKLAVLDDQASIGGVWCNEKLYPSLYAQIKHGLFEYSFYPMRHEGMTADDYISAQAINTYLQDFAWDYDLTRRTRLSTKVSRISRLENGQWRLELDGGKTPIHCTKLIYAAGATSHPVVPTWPGSGKFDAPIIHSSDTGKHLGALDHINSATVVGGAKSAYDTVFLLLKAGKRVDWIIRETGSGPLAIMPPTLPGLGNSMDIIATRFLALMGCCIMSTDEPGHQFLKRTAVGRWLVFMFWMIVNWLASRHAGYSRSENGAKLRPLPHGNGIYWAHAGLGAASVPDFWKTFHAGNCTVHRTDIASLNPGKQVQLRDGTEIQTDLVVLATGFDKPFQVFDESLQRQLNATADPARAEKWARLEREAELRVDERLPELRGSPFESWQFKREDEAGGRRLLHGPSQHYRRLVVPELAAGGDRSIFFPGFIHTIYTPLVAEVQALWGVAFLSGQLDLPPEAEMQREIAEWHVWCRKRYAAQGHKHAYAIFDFIPYIDTLLKDLGVNHRRKKGVLANLFTPSYPREYRGMVDEFRAARARSREWEREREREEEKGEGQEEKKKKWRRNMKGEMEWICECQRSTLPPLQLQVGRHLGRGDVGEGLTF